MSMSLETALQIIHGEDRTATHDQWIEAARILTDRSIYTLLTPGVRNYVRALTKSDPCNVETH